MPIAMPNAVPEETPRDRARGSTDRLHHPDLAGLLADDSVHRGVDQDQRGDHRNARDQVEEDREVAEIVRARPGPGRPGLQDVPVGEVGELGCEDRPQLGDHRADRRRSRVGGEDVDRVRRRITHHPLHVGVRHVQHGRVVEHLGAVAQRATAPPHLEIHPAPARRTDLDRVADVRCESAGPAVLGIGHQLTRLGREPAPVEPDDVDQLVVEVGDADQDHALGAAAEPDLGAGERADVEGLDVVDHPDADELLVGQVGDGRREPGGVHRVGLDPPIER